VISLCEVDFAISSLISVISAKVYEISLSVGPLGRNFYQYLPHIKCNLYKSMVRPIIEFASHVWDPHTILYTNKIESIHDQRSAVRFCFNNYFRTSSVTIMLNKLNLATLKDRRFRSKSIMMIKY